MRTEGFSPIGEIPGSSFLVKAYNCELKTTTKEFYTEPSLEFRCFCWIVRP
jgi:hypothetical protein